MLEITSQSVDPGTQNPKLYLKDHGEILTDIDSVRNLHSSSHVASSLLLIYSPSGARVPGRERVA